MATEARSRSRLDPEVFRLPVERIRAGYYTDAYFNLTKELLEAEGRRPRVTMQAFQKESSVLGGVDEAIAVLRQCSGRDDPGGWRVGWDDLEVRALHEGDEVSPHEPVLESECDTVAAASAFAERYADQMNVTVLVDFANDSVRTSLEVADALGERLWGVRLDTSESMVDRTLWHDMGDFKPAGVTPELVQRVRSALDAAGHQGVRIVASGGFDAAEIARFEELGASVDAYGVGSSLLRGEGRHCAKAGRRYRPNPRLEAVL